MKLYKIIINNPIKDGLKEVCINEEMLAKLAPVMNDKKLVKIGDGYINTAYIVLIEPDREGMREEAEALKLANEVKQLK